MALQLQLQSISRSFSSKERPSLRQSRRGGGGGVSVLSVRAVSRGGDAKKGGGGGGGLPNSANYVVPLDKSFSAANSSCITRPLAEILRDLNKRIPDNIIKSSPSHPPFIPWSYSYTHTNITHLHIIITFRIICVNLINRVVCVICRYHANRMLSFYAPGLSSYFSFTLLCDCVFCLIKDKLFKNKQK